MRQIGSQNDDPLKRIQIEINEVAKREREYQAKHQLNGTSPSTSTPNSLMDNSINFGGTDCADDSGISSSSSPINGTSANSTRDETILSKNKYKRSVTTVVHHQPIEPYMKLTRAVSTPHIFSGTPIGKFMVKPGQKGIMQRFIASRGRLGNIGKTINGTISNADVVKPPTIELKEPIYVPPVDLSPPVIERDEDGRPLRPGYIPVEEKILRELRDIKLRETELKRQRRKRNQTGLEIRKSQSDLMANGIRELDEDREEYTDDTDTDDEHCFFPGKLRASKSIGDVCDSFASSSLSPRNTPSPGGYHLPSNGRNELRPAISLAQLCDVDPTETPSSHKLIAQWENLIQQKQDVA